MAEKIAEKNLSKLVLYGVALAMGVATVVLSVMSERGLMVLGEGDNTFTMLLGIGMFCLALAGLDTLKKV